LKASASAIAAGIVSAIFNVFAFAPRCPFHGVCPLSLLGRMVAPAGPPKPVA
jgi:hypothetical protein